MLIPFKNHVVFLNCFVPIDGMLRHCHVSVRQGVIDAITIASDITFGSVNTYGINNFGEVSDDDHHENTIRFECSGKILAPGFIDIQLNGAFGTDFSNPDVTAQDVLSVASKLTRYGVTGFCPTMVSSSKETYAKVISVIGKLCVQDRWETSKLGHANLCGMHLEGPFFARSKCGAHEKELIQEKMDKNTSFTDVYGYNAQCLFDAGVSIVTLAPELPGALNSIQSLVENDIVVSMGHTNASLSDGLIAKRRGASLITHLYNAMRPFHHREPGLIGMLQNQTQTISQGQGDDQNNIFYSIIADGLHSHPAAVKMAYSLSDNVVLVTDAMCAMGLKNGRHKLGSMQIDVKNLKATVSGTNTLAGSVASMDSCVKNFKRFTGCGVFEALTAATTNPAKVLGIDEKKGSIRVGMDADLVLLDRDLSVLRTVVSGYIVYSRDENCSVYHKHAIQMKNVDKKRKLPDRD